MSEPVLDQVLEHVLERVAAAPRRDAPFAHLYFERILPEPFYERLLASLPAPELYEPLYHKDALRPDGSTTRSTFTLDERSIRRAPPEAQPVLRACARVFGSDAFREAVLARYADVLDARFGPGGAPALACTVKLQRDLPGYRIGIHPDTEDKVVLVQLYLPAGDAGERMGTSLYVASDGGFEKVDTLAFCRNSGYSFARTTTSFHGVEPIDALRYSLTVNFRLRDARLRRAWRKRALRPLRRWWRRVRSRPAAA